MRSPVWIYSSIPGCIRVVPILPGFHTASFTINHFVCTVITLKALIHNDRLNIGIVGKFPSTIYNFIRNYSGIRYSSTHRCFYLEYDPAAIADFKRGLGSLTSVHDDFSAVIQNPNDRKKYIKPLIAFPDEFESLLLKLRYSDATRKNYLSQCKAFLEFILSKANGSGG